MLDQTLVSEPESPMLGPTSQSLALSGWLTCLTNHCTWLCGQHGPAYGRVALPRAETSSELSFRTRSKTPILSRLALSALATVSTLVARCLVAHCNAAGRHFGQQQQWELLCTRALSGGTRDAEKDEGLDSEPVDEEDVDPEGALDSEGDSALGDKDSQLDPCVACGLSLQQSLHPSQNKTSVDTCVEAASHPSRDICDPSRSIHDVPL